MAGRHWTRYPARYREALEYFLERKGDEFAIECLDQSAASSTRRDLQRWFDLIRKEAAKAEQSESSVLLKRYNSIVDEILIAKRGPILILTWRAKYTTPGIAKMISDKDRTVEHSLLTAEAEEIKRKIMKGEKI